MKIDKCSALIIIACLVFSALLVRYLDRVPKRHYCDFRVYYKAGQDLIAGKDLYFRETEDITPYKYSPFFAFIFAPLSLLPIKTSAAVFFAINFLAAVILFRLSFQLVQTCSGSPGLSFKEKWLIYFLAVVCVLRYVFLVWDSGQVNVLMCALVLAGLLKGLKGHDLMAGLCFAAAVLIKYTPAIFLPYLLFQRKFKLVMWSVVFMGVFSLLPALVVGFKKDVFYLSVWIPSIMSTSLDQFSYLVSKNQSIYSMFVRFFSHTYYNIEKFKWSFDQALGLGRWAALLLYAVIFIPGKSREMGTIVDYAALSICMSLFNPNGWLLNFISLSLASMLLVQHLIVVKWRDMFLSSLFCIAFIILNIASRDFVGAKLEDLGLMYSLTTIGSLVVYIALLRLKFMPSGAIVR